MRSTNSLYGVFFSAVAAIIAGRATGQPLGTAFTYQGELANSGVAAVGSYDLRFRLFDAPTGGSQIGATLCADNVSIIDGRFTVSLDFGNVFAGQKRFAEIEVRTDSGLGCMNPAGFVILGPRQELSGAPNAIFALTSAAAANATQLNGQSATYYTSAANLSSGTLPSARLSGTYSGALVFSNASNTFTGSGAGLTALNATNISGGTLADARLSSNVALLSGAQTFSGAKAFSLAPSFAAAGAPFSVLASGVVTNLNADLLDGLHSSAFLQAVPTPLTLTGSSITHIIRGDNTSTAAGSAAILGISTSSVGITYGGWYRTESMSGTGVYGWAASTNGDSSGVRGRADGSSGNGVFGQATSSTGITYGGRFETASTDGTGSMGLATATTGLAYGVYGQSSSTSGIGLFGLANAATGNAIGVHGVSNSAQGIAVDGWATATSGFATGISAQCDSTNGTGLYAYASAATGSNYGINCISASTSGIAIYAQAPATSGTTYGGLFTNNSPSGTGVSATAYAATGFTRGVFGSSTSTSGTGVYGWASALTGVTNGVNGSSGSTNGIGVFGSAIAPTGLNYGGSFQSASTSGVGVRGEAAALSGSTFGVNGVSRSPDGRGVLGLASAGTGTARGVEGQTSSTSGTAVFGTASSATGFAYGVYGESNSTSGRGVSGWALATTGSTIGVEGFANSAAGYGVRGEAGGGAGFGLWASGKSGASGTKSFRIDHPDDPANKYLLHYSVEGPEVINSYRGNVDLDASGEAVVQLPRYFARINTNPSYQLTAIGAPMPMLHVALEIDPAAMNAGAIAAPGDNAPVCMFRIAGGAPGAKVSWEVKAVRNDLWVRRYGASVEVEKPGIEKGTYQHPDLYGQPPEKALNFDVARK